MSNYIDLTKSLLKLVDQEKGITLIKSNEDERYISYKKLYENSIVVYETLKKRGVKKGNEVVIQCKDTENFMYTFWACVFGGFIAIPISKSNNQYKSSVNDKIISILEKPYCVYDDSEDKNIDFSIFEGRTINLDLIDYDKYELNKDISKEISTDSNDILYIQFSSGSTGEPKGAIIRKSNVSTNISDIITRLEMSTEDKCLSWQPLTHCYGLTVFHILPIILGVDQYLVTTELFMHSPLIWLEKADKYRITRLGTIPFALKHFMNFFEKSGFAYHWDLSCIKTITIGGEQVTFDICDKFTELMKNHKLYKNVMIPIYGLAEATTAVSLLNFNTPLKASKIARCEIEIGKEITCSEETSNDGMTFLQLGKALDSNQVIIIDDNNYSLPEGIIGHILVKGGNVSEGYYKEKHITSKVFLDDGWLDTGDIGFIRDGNVVVVGREKELIVSNGVKYTCIDIEDIINKKVFLHKFGQVVACNGLDDKNKSEKAVVFIENSNSFNDRSVIDNFNEVSGNIKKVVFETAGLTIDTVIPIETIPKTSSGKIRRKELSNRFNGGEFITVLKKLSDIDTKESVQEEKTTLSIIKIRSIVVDTIETMFKIKVTDFDSPFQEYGIVSVNIPFFIKRINEVFSTNIQVSAFFSYPSVNQFTNFVFKVKNEKKEKMGEVAMDNINVTDDERIAIIGMSCRFPGGANSIKEYWDMLLAGNDGISEVPDTRWDLEKYYDEDENAPGKMYCRKGGFLNVPIDEFDAKFFNISPKEAIALDPQQRIMLEITWEAFENANLDITKYSGTNTGVYLGMSTVEYTLSHLYSGDLSNIDAYSLTGGCMSTACGRIAYTFGFEGPCITVDTACSSALSALHLACKAMKSGEADLVVVGGVNLMVTPSNNIGFSKLHATSPDGHSKAFDASANGYGRGEGAGAIILKRLSDAIKDDDNILGVIRGTAINQDGRSNGLTAPNGGAQAKLIRNTLSEAGLFPTDIDYVEMHGTGTKLGDPIEVGAVSEVYCNGRNINEPLKIGSVKSNIGHLEAAAGIASIAKVLMSMKNKVIPGNLHFNTPNPLINWGESNVKVISEHTGWYKDNGPRRAAINGFGFGGSNAHVIIEEYRDIKTTNQEEEDRIEGVNYILKISAKSEKSLQQQVRNFAKVIKDSEDNVFEDIIYSANRGRADLDHRLAVIGNSKEEILERLESYLEDEDIEGLYSSVGDRKLFKKDRKIVFMFTGQGSQYVNMGKLLFETNDVFKEAMEQCDKLFKPFILKSIISLLYSENASSEVIEKTVYAQPLIFTIEYALFKLWESVGVKPEVVMGHSIGEYAGAVVSGIINLEDAVKLVSIRGRLMDSAPGSGAMGTIFASEDIVNSLIEEYKDSVSIAAHNAKETCVISGDSSLVEKILNQAEAKGIRVKKLKVSHGFHSKLMEPILEDFEVIANEVNYGLPKVRFVSSAYAREISESETLDYKYWTNHIRDKVDFYKALLSIKDSEEYVLLEVGSNRVLSALCKLIYDEERIIASSLNIKKEDSVQLAETIALLYVSGVNIDWDNIRFKGKKVWNNYLLPNYPFERISYWRELTYDRKVSNIACDDSNHRLLGQRIESPTMNDSVVFQRKFLADNPFFMGEHIIFDTPISPAAAHISMLLSTIKELKNPVSCNIKDIELRSPLAIYNDEERTVQVCIENSSESESKFSLVSREMQSTDSKWKIHTQGAISSSKDVYEPERELELGAFENSEFDHNVEGNLYDFMREHGFELGDGFRRITKTLYVDGASICFIEPLKSIPELDTYELYPGVIDSILQTLFYEVLDELKAGLKNSNGENTIIPYYIGNITYNYKKSKKLWCRTTATFKDNVIYGTIDAFNEQGEFIMQIKDVMAKLTDKESLLREMKNNHRNLYYHTDWIKEADKKELVINQSEQYVLVSDDAKVLSHISESLSEKGISSINVICGDSFNKENKETYVVDYHKENWTKLLESILDTYNDAKLKFVYINGASSNNDSLDNIKTDSLKGILYLVQAINSTGIESKSKIKIVTKNVQKIEPVGNINLSQSMVWGFAKVLGIEFPQIFDGIVDVNEEGMFADNSILINEIISNNIEEVCIRGKNNRYVSKLVKNSEYVKKGYEKAAKISIKEDATYVITGGTGALGMVYAEYLINQGAKNIVLVCRRKPEGEVSETIDKLIAQGINLEVVLADVCNRESIEAAIADIRERSTKISGVIHAAGTLSDKMIADQSWEDFERVLSPKVEGTINIYNALNKEELDCFIMLSSITSVIGNMGQSNYSAANYFMNSFAAQMGINKLPGYTFCWGPWQGRGMVSENTAISKNMDNLGIKTFAPETGIKIISEFFEQPYESMLIVDIDWNKFSGSPSGESKKEFLAQVIEQTQEKDSAIDSSKNNAILEELKALDKEQKKVLLVGEIQKICAKIMGFPKGQFPASDISFTEQGVDSLMVFSMRSSINKLLKTDLSVSSFFNYPTILKLTDYLIDEVLFANEEEQEDIQESTEDLLSELALLTE